MGRAYTPFPSAEIPLWGFYFNLNLRATSYVNLEFSIFLLGVRLVKDKLFKVYAFTLLGS